MRERRDGLSTDTGHARRWNDKIFSFAVFLLLVFLANWLIGCAGAAKGAESSRFQAPDCQAEPDDFRCQVYEPEEDILADEEELGALDDIEF